MKSIFTKKWFQTSTNITPLFLYKSSTKVLIHNILIRMREQFAAYRQPVAISKRANQGLVRTLLTTLFVPARCTNTVSSEELTTKSLILSFYKLEATLSVKLFFTFTTLSSSFFASPNISPSFSDTTRMLIYNSIHLNYSSLHILQNTLNLSHLTKNFYKKCKKCNHHFP